MTTVRDLINLSLKEAGVLGIGQTAHAEDVNDAFVLLNNMIGQWQARRWLVYSLKDSSITANGSISYTIGPGGDFNMARPDKIQSAFIRQPLIPSNNPVDFPLTQIFSREGYSQIATKQLKSFPKYFFYDNSWPRGNLFVWPVPTSIYDIHITTKADLQVFTNLSDTINLPPEYFEALHYNLAVRLRPMYQLPPEPSITQLAKVSLNTVRNANAQVQSLDIPQALTSGGHYNVYSDQVT